jgi:hypothetical protein
MKATSSLASVHARPTMTEEVRRVLASGWSTRRMYEWALRQVSIYCATDVVAATRITRARGRIHRLDSIVLRCSEASRDPHCLVRLDPPSSPRFSPAGHVLVTYFRKPDPGLRSGVSRYVGLSLHRNDCDFCPCERRWVDDFWHLLAPLHLRRTWTPQAIPTVDPSLEPVLVYLISGGALQSAPPEMGVSRDEFDSSVRRLYSHFRVRTRRELVRAARAASNATTAPPRPH